MVGQTVPEAGLKEISRIKGFNFLVPNYQRGYKWRRKDVEYLIQDIAEIGEEDNSDYCLQPIVVAPKDDGKWILVDGQQRLTTLWLIMTWAKWHIEKESAFDVDFSIEYDVRAQSNDYLKELKENGNATDKGSCDTHYFSEAIEAIKEKKKDYLVQFLINLHKNVRLIWYVIDAKEGPKHFERLNNAKISLTNAELVKAYLFTNVGERERAKMSVEWDDIEYSLQDDRFFSFITKIDSCYRKDYNRIELLLDLYIGTTSKNKECDEYYTFNRIVEKKEALDVWKEIQKVYNRIETWYEDNYLYNLIGYLIESKSCSLSDIWKVCNNISLDGFKARIREIVYKSIEGIEISTLQYKDRNTRKVLLLFNVLSLMSVDESKNGMSKYIFNDRFHFDLFQSENWDVEHVHATASESLTKEDEWKDWMRMLDIEVVKECMREHEKSNQYLSKLREIQEMTEDNLKGEKINKSEFTVMYNAIVQAMEGDNKDVVFEQNSIGNLVLLNRGINRANAYKVSPFSTKRSIIMDRVRTGAFVPLATQNVFMKVYTPKPKNFYKWEKNNLGEKGTQEKCDREYYIEEIEKCIKRLKD